MVRKNGACDLLRRSDGLAWRGETFLELSRKLLEQLDVFGFLACKPQERPGAVVVAVELRSRMVEDERQNELFHQAECIEVAVAADLVQKEFLFRRQKIHRIDARQRFGQKGA